MDRDRKRTSSETAAKEYGGSRDRRAASDGSSASDGDGKNDNDNSDKKPSKLFSFKPDLSFHMFDETR